MFITFEGGEGVGKSTNILRLKEWLEAEGIEVVVTREPGGTPIAERIRNDLLKANHAESMQSMTELLLVFAARAQHWARLIKPSLEAGKWVICDRFNDSTVAYQGYGRGISLDTINSLKQMSLDGTEPDLTILLDAPVQLGLARAADRSKQNNEEIDRFEIEKKAFFERVRSGFLTLADNEKRIKTIDASQPLENVTNDIIDTVRTIRDRMLCL